MFEVKRCLFDGKHDMPGWEANIIWFLFTGEQIEFPGDINFLHILQNVKKILRNMHCR